jgi:hypothetical protein
MPLTTHGGIHINMYRKLHKDVYEGFSEGFCTFSHDGHWYEVNI